MNTTRCMALTAFALAIAAGSAQAQVLQMLGEPAPGLGSSAAGVSADGTVVSSNSSRPYVLHGMNIGMPVGYRWTAALGWQAVGIDSQVGAVSGDGSTILGLEFLGSVNGPGPGRGFRWRPPSGPQFLDAQLGGVSFDGSVVGGARLNANQHYDAVRWTAAGGYQSLGHFLPGPNADGWTAAVSADGSVITGADGDAFDNTSYRAFVWTAAQGMQPLGSLPGAPIAYQVWPGAISADGSVIVGAAPGASGLQQAFYWTQAQGMLPLRLLPGFTQSYATSVSADGSVVVGYMEGAGPGAFMGFIWDRALGMRDLRQVLMSRGSPDLTGWTLEPHGVSADGGTIVGAGNGPGTPGGAFIARIGAFCYANCDGSTAPPILNVADFVCFQQRFAAGDAYTNCDRSTSAPILNVTDFVCFMSAFAAGCP